MIEPLQFTIDLDCSRDHAFDVWTTRFSTWWPAGHSVSGEPDVAVILEARQGGRIFERTTDGREIDWGEVTVWDPPDRFNYLWHIHRDRSDATDVEVSFLDTVGGGCQVHIVHSGWERLGASGPEWRNRNQGGWEGLLPHFIAAAS